MSRTMNLALNVWRQKEPKAPGQFVRYEASKNVNVHMSFLEMLDVVNEGLIAKGEAAIAFDHDCREGICGMCGVVIDGVPHGPLRGTTTCQLHMRSFKDGDELTVEPWRAGAFPVVRDLVVDRSAFDRIIQAGGYVSLRTGSAPESQFVADCQARFGLGVRCGDVHRRCGACVAACPNGSAALFTAAKVSRTWRSCRRASPSAPTAPAKWSRKWTPKASATARATKSAKPPARRASASASSPR